MTSATEGAAHKAREMYVALRETPIIESTDYNDATDGDLRLAISAIGGLARYGNFLNSALAGIYAERANASVLRAAVLAELLEEAERSEHKAAAVFVGRMITKEQQQ